MTKPSLIARCTLSEQCLPDAPYRAMLCKLHKDMLDEIDRLKAAQPAAQEKCFLCGERVDSCASDVCPKAAQPVPVKTYHDGKPWPVAPKPWVGLTDEEAQWIYDNGRTPSGMMEMVEAKLKEKNT